MPKFMENLDAYAAFFIAGVKNSVSYKKNVMFSLLFKIAFAVIMVLVWTAIYFNTNSATIGGLTLKQVYAYFFVYSAIWLIINLGISVIVQNDVQSGGIAAQLTRPTNYILQVFFYSLGDQPIWILFVSIPLIFIVNFFVPITLTAVSALAFLAEILLGLVAASLIDFFIATLVFYLDHIWGVISASQYAINILSGGILPLVFFAPQINGVLMLLPFQMFGYTETATLLGIISIPAIITELLVTLAWVLILSVLGVFWWKRVVRKIKGAGG